jgi:hypothetical protein
MAEKDTNLEKLVKKFRRHINSSVSKYGKQHRHKNLEVTAKALKIPRATLSHYDRGSFPLWPSYFSLMLKLKDEEPDKDRIDTLVKNLGNLLAKSIKLHCSVNNNYATEFCKSLGFNRQTAYNWTSPGGHLPRTKVYFKIMSAIYSGDDSDDVIMQPLVNWNILENGEYLGLLEIIRSGARPAPVQVAVEKPSKDELADLVRKPNDYIFESPKANAHLAKETLLRLGKLLSYFRSRGAEDRKTLIEVCGPEYRKIRDTVIEVRSVLFQSEEEYQAFLKMNEDLKTD